MINYSLKPTDENAIELLRADAIGRNRSVFRFIELLGNIQESCTIAINGEWGYPEVPAPDPAQAPGQFAPDSV